MKQEHQQLGTVIQGLLLFYLAGISACGSDEEPKPEPEPESTIPTAELITPMNGATDVNPLTDLVFMFTEEMDPESITDASTDETSTDFLLTGDLTGPRVGNTFTWSEGNTILTVSFDVPLAGLEHYSGTLTRHVASAKGVGLAEDYTFEFRTDETYLEISTRRGKLVRPDIDGGELDGSIYVPANTWIQVDFPAPINIDQQFTFGEDFLEFYKYNGATNRERLSGSGVWSNGDTRFTFTPDALLEYDQEYLATVPGTIELASGGTISSGVNEIFKTADGPVGVVITRPRGIALEPDERIQYIQQFGVDFNVPMDQDSVRNAITIESNRALTPEFDLLWSEDDLTVGIHYPNQRVLGLNIGGDAQVILNISTDAVDKIGDPIAEAFEVEFRSLDFQRGDCYMASGVDDAIVQELQCDPGQVCGLQVGEFDYNIFEIPGGVPAIEQEYAGGLFCVDVSECDGDNWCECLGCDRTCGANRHGMFTCRTEVPHDRPVDFDEPGLSTTSDICVEENYSETRTSASAFISDIELEEDIYTFYMDVLTERYPWGKTIINNALEFEFTDCLTEFSVNVSASDDAIGRLSTLIHECGHAFDISTAHMGGYNFQVAPGLNFDCAEPTMLSRGEIVGDDFEADNPDDGFRGLYLDGGGGSAGFGSLMTEMNQYINSLAVTIQFTDYYGAHRRDGTQTFLWYMTRYLNLARTQHAEIYEELASDSCWRGAILSMWDRGQYYLHISADEGGASGDGAAAAAIENELLLEEIQLLRDREAC